MLAEQDLMLGTIECGTDGVVSRQVFDAADGPNVLGYSLVVNEAEEAIGVVDLPRPQFEKAGDFSAKAARAAAREGCDFLGVDVCLAVWVSAPIAVDAADRRPMHVALNTGGEVIGRTLRYDGPNERALSWVAEQALHMVHQALSQHRTAAG